MILARKCGSRQTQRLEQQAESSHLEMQALDGEEYTGNGQWLWNFKAHPGDILSSTRPHLLKLPKQGHQLELSTQLSIRAYGGHSHLNRHKQLPSSWATKGSKHRIFMYMILEGLNESHFLESDRKKVSVRLTVADRILRSFLTNYSDQKKLRPVVSQSLSWGLEMELTKNLADGAYRETLFNGLVFVTAACARRDVQNRKRP